MPRVVYYTATSFNGFIATPDNSLEWLFEVGGPDGLDFDRFLAGIDVIVMGSTTYRWLLDHEQLVERPEQWTGMYADRPVFVFTSRELPVPEGTPVRLVNGLVDGWIDEIRGAAGDGDVWVVGGGDLAGQFLDAGALDEIQVTMVPVALPDGAPLLPREVRSDRLVLESAEKFGQFAHLTFTVRTP